MGRCPVCSGIYRTGGQQGEQGWAIEVWESWIISQVGVRGPRRGKVQPLKEEVGLKGGLEGTLSWACL